MSVSRKSSKTTKQFPKSSTTPANGSTKAEGYPGGLTQVKEAVRGIKRLNQEVFMPLGHRPGEAQVDFGFAVAKVAGVLQKIAFFVMVLPHSDAFFVMAFERECTETYWEGHIRGFEFFGGVPNRISYDNSKVLVSQVLSSCERKPTDGFLKLQSHYLFREHFCRIRRANANQVQQALLNVCTNAWEAIGGSRGTIQLTVRVIPPEEIPASNRLPLGWQPQGRPYACIEVTDSGCGVASKDIDKLFDPFFSSKFAGRGWGLLVVLGVVKTCDGGVSVESRPGKGSTFRVYFPVLDDNATQTEHAADVPIITAAGKVLTIC